MNSMMETRRNLFKKLTIGALTLLATSKRALSSYFSDMLTTSDFAGDSNAGSSEVADFYVAPNGKDSNPGTAMAPFATLAGARNAVRKKISNGLTHNLLVLIRGGTYGQTETLTFGPEDSGTEK
jgi:hypothetical protein